MNLRPLLRQIVFLLMLSFVSFHTVAQSDHVTYHPFKSSKVEVESYEWTFGKTQDTADVKLIVTNKSKLEIKSINIYVTAVNRKGIMLQSNSSQTIKAKTMEISILPEETKTLIFKDAFSNPDIYKLTLQRTTIEFANGSLEILNVSTF